MENFDVVVAGAGEEVARLVTTGTAPLLAPF
jgi:hypothetical protein